MPAMRIKKGLASLKSLNGAPSRLFAAVLPLSLVNKQTSDDDARANRIDRRASANLGNCMKAVIITLIAVLLSGSAAMGASHKAYCYATAQSSGSKFSRYFGKECTIYITPVFLTDDSEDLLSAEFNESITDAGIATCVTDDDEPDLPKAWQQFMDNGKAGKCTIVMQPAPGQTPPDGSGGNG